MLLIRNFEDRLAEHFARISENREPGRIFLIEHGLDIDDLDTLLFIVGERAVQHGFDNRAWGEFPLTLCVAMTEFGYSYSGDDFWPTAEHGLKAEIRIEERGSITEQFRRLHGRLGIAAPLDDSWSEAFGHIAWPIRNAMVPKEIHAPVARIVREALRHIQDIRIDAQFLGLMKSLASGMNSRRLDAWLSDETLATTVVRSLIADDMTTMDMEAPFLSRLGNDLRSNSEFHRLGLAVRTRRAAKSFGQLRLPQARLQLVLRDAEPLGLAVRGPKLDAGEKQLLRERFGILPAAMGISFGVRTTSLESFLDGEVLFLGRRANVPEPVVTGSTDIPGEVSLAVSPPSRLVFLDCGDDGFQPQLDDSSIPETGLGFYELRLAEATQGDWAEHLYHYIAGQTEGDERLKAHGLLPPKKPLLRFHGGMTLTRAGNQWQQREGRPLFMQATGPGTTLDIQATDGSFDVSLPVRDDVWLCLPRTEGNYRLEVRGQGRDDTIELEFRPSAPTDAVALQLHPHAVRLFDIASGGAFISLQSPITLEDAVLRIELISTSGDSVSVKMTVPEVPCVIGMDADALKPIRDSARLWVASGAAARLNVTAGELDQRSWLLPAKIQAWSFQRGSSLWVNGDGTRVPSQIADPMVDPVGFRKIGSVDKGMTALITPATDADDSVFSGIVNLAAGSLRPGDFRLPAPLNLSRAPEDHDSVRGLISAVEAFVAWRVAFAPTAAADALRGQSAQLIEDSLIAVLCGESWSQSEKRNRGMSGGFHQRLAKLACERKLAMGDEESFTPLPPEYEPVLLKCLESRLRKAFPDPKMISVPNEEYWEELDDVLYGAWDDMLGLVPAETADNLECFGKCLVEPWHLAMEDARKISRLPDLSKWILPESRRNGLVEFNYETGSLPDLIAEIELWHHDLIRTGARWITPAEIRALLLLFLEPTRLSEEPEWRGRIARFGSDRFTARAIRYAALRKNALRHRQ